MARKQQELKSVISVYGKADGSLDTLAKKIKSFGDNVSKIGGAMTMMTAPIIAAIKTSTSLYTDYDDILRKILLYLKEIGIICNCFNNIADIVRLGRIGR